MMMIVAQSYGRYLLCVTYVKPHSSLLEDLAIWGRGRWSYLPKMTERVTQSGVQVRRFSLRSAWTLQTLVSPASSPPKTKDPLTLSSSRFPTVCSFGSPQLHLRPQLLACPPLANPGHLSLHHLMLLFDTIHTDRHTRTLSPAAPVFAGDALASMSPTLLRLTLLKPTGSPPSGVALRRSPLVSHDAAPQVAWRR